MQRFDATTQPASPVAGQCWALGNTPTGVWAGHGDEIATFAGGGWLFISPGPGWRAWGLAENALKVWQGAAWASIGLDVTDLNNLPSVGINAAADATNRLTVSAPATLFNHAGGSHQIKVNKANAGATASLLYQTNYSGRAEMGLTGNDDFSIKVSANGSTFTEALRIDAASGAVTLPQTRIRQILPYSYRHYLFVDRRWASPTADSAVRDASQNLGTGAEPNVEWDTKGIFLPAGTALSQFWLAGNLTTADTPDLDVRIYFQYGAWTGSWKSVPETLRDTLYTQNNIGMTTAGAMRQFKLPLSYVTPTEGYVFLAMRPSAGATLQGTRYAQIAGAFDVRFLP